MIHLHNHTEYSLLDGMSTVEDLVKRAKELGQEAIAITDHGSLHGTIEFYETCRKHGLKPIIGCELYIVPDRLQKNKKELKEAGIENRHIVLLATNEVGYHNLVSIVSDAHLEGFYSKPRTDMSVLRKHSEGIIALSACLEGEIPHLILQEERTQATLLIEEYKEIFGDNFYLELQANTLPEQATVNAELIRLGRLTETPLVVTCDSHYVLREDAPIHDVVLAIGTGKKVTDEDRMTFNADDFYLKSEEEIRELVPVDEAIANTRQIADKVDLSIDIHSGLLPHIDVPEGYTEDTYLAKMCHDGLYELFRKEPDLDEKKYLDRLNYELGIIKDKGRAGYLLIVHDFVQFAREQKIPVGPGRGSAAGSLISYLIGITAIDPIKYDLLFERFLNPERVEMPDIDIDFCNDRRHLVKEYVVNKYGQDKVASVITFGSLTARACLDNVATVLGMEFKDRKAITKTVPEIPKITIEEALELSPELQEHRKTHPRLFEIALRLEGRKRHSSTHACGVVIAPRPLTNFTALRRTEGSKGDIATHLDMETLEKVGLPKFDFLGLKTLTAIYYALELIDEDIDINAIPLDDPATYAMLNSGYLDGIFQFEKSWAASMMQRIKPDKFEDIIDAGALLRPGPLDSGATNEYINAKRGLRQVEYAHPDLEPILKSTYGVLVYQEQVIRIAQVLASYTAGEGDSFRKAVGKKIKELIEAQLKIFTERALANGYAQDFVEDIAGQIAKHARYGFNKSHAAAYGLITYQTGYLKAHYPVEFMAATMTAEMDNSDKVTQYISECKRLNIPILPPDVNRSKMSFTVEGDKIRYNLASIKHLAGKVAQEIVRHQPYRNLKDIYDRVDRRIINKTSMIALIKSGALDNMNPNRKELIKEYFKLRLQHFRDKDADGNRIDPETMDTDFSKTDAFMMEKEVLPIYLSGHPLEDFVCGDWFSTEDREEVTLTGLVARVSPHKTKKGNEPMAFMDIDTIYGTISVVVFPKVLKRYENHVKQDKILTITGARQDDKLLANHIIKGKVK